MALKLPELPATRYPPRTARNGNSADGWLDKVLPHGLSRDIVEVEQHIREGQFQRSLALITSMSSLLSGLEVAYEHYRGSYSQRIMYTPVILSAGLGVAGVWATFSRRAARTILPLISLITLLDGVIGFVFHVRGIARKPGGWRVPVFNVIMGPPVFAPLLFALSGFLGIITTYLRREEDLGPNDRAGVAYARKRPYHPSARLLPWGVSNHALTVEQQIREGQFQRMMAVAAAISAMFSGVEALYSHYKNNFRYKMQWTPIGLAPLLFVAGIGTIWSRKVARTLLPFASILAILDGGIGTFYHIRGILRRPGGLKLPLYNLMYGSPLFAPMLLAASGFLGLLASLLRRKD